MRTFEEVARSPDAPKFIAGIGGADAPSRVAIARRLVEFGCTSVLDVGCGPGVFMDTLTMKCPGVAYFGVDASQAMCDLAARRIESPAQRVRLFDPLGNETGTDFHADAVVLRHVLEHAGDRWRSLLAWSLHWAAKAVFLAFSQPPNTGAIERETDRYLGLRRWSIPLPPLKELATDLGWTITEKLSQSNSSEVVPREELYVLRKVSP